MIRIGKLCYITQMLKFKRYYFQGDGTKVAWVFGATFLVNKNSNGFFPSRWCDIFEFAKLRDYLH